MSIQLPPCSNPIHAPWHAEIITAFPDIYPGALSFSNIGKALNKGLWQLKTYDLRNFTTNKHLNIDDAPFGGGPGMLICPEIVARAMDSLLELTKNCHIPRIYMSPRGKLFDTNQAKQLANADGIIILCGRYEGVDQRVIDYYQFSEISIGDYVISSGEIASFVLLDAVVRRLPNVIGKSSSLDEESFEHNLLEYPHYTRPAQWRGLRVPTVLLSGHHQRIAQWRLEMSYKYTKKLRPDLYHRHLNSKISHD